MSMPSSFRNRRCQARFSDGETAGSSHVSVQLTDRGIVIHGDRQTDPLVWPYGALAVSEPLTGHSVDVLVTYAYQPGATLFVQGPQFARALAEEAPHLTARAERWRSASPWLWGTAAAIALLLVVWLANLSPARYIAEMLPQSVRDTMGQSVIASMQKDRPVCKSANGIAALDRLTNRLSRAAGDKRAFDVVVLDWGLVNAFATPGENIVLTRGLIEAAKGPDEVAGVLAHEMGHGLEAHPETAIVRAMGLTAAAELLTGGSGTLSNVGIVLLQLSYSRDAEREADDHALAILRDANISAKGFSAFFERMAKKEKGRSGQGGITGMLSTHPDTGERLSKALRHGGYPTTPSMSRQEWTDLQQICKAD